MIFTLMSMEAGVVPEMTDVVMEVVVVVAAAVEMPKIVDLVETEMVSEMVVLVSIIEVEDNNVVALPNR